MTTQATNYFIFEANTSIGDKLQFSLPFSRFKLTSRRNLLDFEFNPNLADRFNDSMIFIEDTPNSKDLIESLLLNGTNISIYLVSGVGYVSTDMNAYAEKVNIIFL